jgi:ankyrin repeat protein
MRAILRNGAEVNPLADLGRFDTPLHEAATRSIDAVKLLLEYGADVKKGDSRLTPLHLATKAGKSDVVGLLAKTWPDGVKLKDQYGRTSLHIAVQMRYIEVVRILLESCPEAMRETASFNGDTVLHEAAWMGTIDMVRLLMERCPEAVKEKNKYGQTPLHLAVGNHPGVIRFLVESWPEGTMEKNDGGNTPLHLAAWRGGSDEVVMRLFVEYWPASKEALNVDGKTPLLVFEEKYPEEEEEHSQPGLSQRQRIIALLGCVH